MSCASPHPVRGPDGVGLAGDLEVVGSHATEAWARCRRCGAWFWCSTDLGGKFEYLGEVTLDGAIAERAFVRGEIDAVAEIVARYPVPHGPIWTTSSALVEMFCALTPGASDQTRADALARQALGTLWAGAARLFAGQAAARDAAPPPLLRFAVDLEVPGYEFAAAHEVGRALVVVPRDRAELLRLEAAGLVRVPLAGMPRVLASRRDAIVFAVATEAGEAIVVLDAAGNATAHQPSASRYRVESLPGDGGWLFVPAAEGVDRWIELRAADGSPRAKLRAHRSSTADPVVRRLGAGWIISNLVTDDDVAQELTLFDAALATIAWSTGMIGVRSITPIDDAAFWTSTDGAMQRWMRRDTALERTHELAIRASWLVGDRLIAELPGGELIACGSDGERLWRWSRGRTTGATYGVATRHGVLCYDDRRAHLVDRDGELVTAFDLDGARVQVGARGTVYLRTAGVLWVVGDHAHAYPIVRELDLVSTCDDQAVLAADGQIVLVAPTGARARFAASTTVPATVGGPYVVEPGRLRVARFAGEADVDRS